MSGSSILHAQIDNLTANASAPLNLERTREQFQENALRALTRGNEENMTADPSNPTLVSEEMELRKDCFRRLKFNYLEQETKRNFLFSITGDDPRAVSPGENEALEASNAEAKAELKAYKAYLDKMTTEAISLAKSNASRHTAIRSGVSEVAALQKQIRDAELELARIRATHPPDTRLTTDQANEKLEEQLVQMQDLQQTVDDNTASDERMREAVSRTTKEVSKLSREREREEARAKEVREGREAGDGKVDELCRWLASSIQFYRSLIGITSVSASVAPGGKQHLLQMSYDIPDNAMSQSQPLPRDAKTGRAQVELVLAFDAASRVFQGASVRGADIAIDESADIAVVTQDVPTLVADVLNRLRPIDASIAA